MYLTEDADNLRIVNLEKDTYGVLLDSWHYYLALKKRKTEKQDFWPKDYKTHTDIKRKHLK